MNLIIRTSVLTFIALIGVSSQAGKSSAAESAGPALTGINYVDLYYDFDFYAGQPRYAWVVIWETSYNGEFEVGEFDTQQDAESYASFQFYNHVVQIKGAKERVNVTGYHVEYKEVDPIMEYIATYDTLVEAENAANYFEMYGYYTEIDFVSLYTYEAP